MIWINDPFIFLGPKAKIDIKGLFDNEGGI